MGPRVFGSNSVALLCRAQLAARPGRIPTGCRNGVISIVGNHSTVTKRGISHVCNLAVAYCEHSSISSEPTNGKGGIVCASG